MRISQEQQKIILIAVSLVLAAILQLFAEYFIYLRDLLWEQPWRLLTAHWVHVGWMHYILNLFAFMCFPFIFPKIKTSFLILLMVIVPILMSLSFYLFYPNIIAYAGFSGVLHGLYATAAFLSLKYRKERPFALLVLAGLTVKLIWEATVGELSMTMQMIGSPILIEAHQLGVLISLVVLLGLYSINKFFPMKILE